LSDTYVTFRNRLKTELFKKSYDKTRQDKTGGKRMQAQAPLYPYFVRHLTNN